jgi:hypothetical protein
MAKTTHKLESTPVTLPVYQALYIKENPPKNQMNSSIYKCAYYSEQYRGQRCAIFST